MKMQNEAFVFGRINAEQTWNALAGDRKGRPYEERRCFGNICREQPLDILPAINETRAVGVIPPAGEMSP